MIYAYICIKEKYTKSCESSDNPEIFFFLFLPREHWILMGSKDFLRKGKMQIEQ